MVCHLCWLSCGNQPQQTSVFNICINAISTVPSGRKTDVHRPNTFARWVGFHPLYALSVINQTFILSVVMLSVAVSTTPHPTANDFKGVERSEINWFVPLPGTRWQAGGSWRRTWRWTGTTDAWPGRRPWRRTRSPCNRSPTEIKKIDYKNGLSYQSFT